MHDFEEVLQNQPTAKNEVEKNRAKKDFNAH